MRRTRVHVDLDASGNGTATTDAPLWGEVAEIRCETGGTAFTASGTVTITRDTGGTIFSGTVPAEDWSYAPHQTVHTQLGGSVGADAPIPVDGYMTVVVAGGGTAVATRHGDIDIYVR